MIYLDYNASTPVDARVASLVQEASHAYANPPSSTSIAQVSRPPS